MAVLVLRGLVDATDTPDATRHSGRSLRRQGGNDARGRQLVVSQRPVALAQNTNGAERVHWLIDALGRAGMTVKI